MASRKGIPKPHWTPEQHAALLEWGPKIKTSELAVRIGRTPIAIRSRASLIGLTLRYRCKYLGSERGGRNLRPTQRPTTRALEWASGFLEGEGCFRNTGSTELVEAKQVNREPLERLLALFGGKLLFASMEYARRRGVRANDIWIWKICGGRARGVMLTLCGLLSAKRRRQIAKALRSCPR